MNSLKKILLLLVAVTSFGLASYNLVWSPDWQAKRWPESQLRAPYVASMARALVDFSGTEKEVLIQRHLQNYDAEIETKIFNSVLISVGLSLLLTAATALLPALAGSGKEGRVRGARLVTALQLMRELWWRENKKAVLLGGVYSVFFSLSGLLMFKSALAVPVGFALGLVVFIVAERVSAKPRPAQVHLGGIPIPREAEGRHTCVFGTTGSGKSMAIYGVMHDARRRGDRGIVADIGGAGMQRFLRKADIVLAPGEAWATAKWNPFCEIRRATDFAEMAANAIPDSPGENQQWVDMARVLLAEVMRSLFNSGDHSVSRLLHVCCVASRQEMAPIVGNTPAAVFTADDADRLLVSVRSVLGTALSGWQTLDDQGNFSIREWVRTAPPGQWLFLRYTDGNVRVMRQLLATWLKIAISETISDDKNVPPPTWFVADEFSSLGQVPSAADGAAKLRRYNGKILWGVQSVAQLWVTYGRDAATVLLSCLNTKLYLAAGDPETGEWCSKAIGDQERIRQEQSRSRRGLFGLGGDASKSEAERQLVETLVLPSELQTLPALHGFLKLAGDHPVARVKIPIPACEKRLS